MPSALPRLAPSDPGYSPRQSRVTIDASQPTRANRQRSSGSFISVNSAGGADHDLDGQPSLMSNRSFRSASGKLPEHCFPLSRRASQMAGLETRKEIDIKVLLKDGRTVHLKNVAPEETAEDIVNRLSQADAGGGFMVGARGKLWATRDLRGNLLPEVRLLHMGAPLQPGATVKAAKMQNGALLKLIPAVESYMDSQYVTRPAEKRPWQPRANSELAQQMPKWSPLPSVRESVLRLRAADTQYSLLDEPWDSQDEEDGGELEFEAEFPSIISLPDPRAIGRAVGDMQTHWSVDGAENAASWPALAQAPGKSPAGGPQSARRAKMQMEEVLQDALRGESISRFNSEVGTTRQVSSSSAR